MNADAGGSVGHNAQAPEEAQRPLDFERWSLDSETAQFEGGSKHDGNSCRSSLDIDGVAVESERQGKSQTKRPSQSRKEQQHQKAVQKKYGPVGSLSKIKRLLSSSGGDFSDEEEQLGGERDTLLAPAPSSCYVDADDQSEGKESEYWKEAKRLWNLAVPIAFMQVLWYARTVASLIFVGHLGGVQLAGIALASTFASVSGYAIMFGLASGMDPLCSQAVGAKEYAAVGLTLQRGWAVLLCVCVPTFATWWNVEPFFRFARQDPVLTGFASEYLRILTLDLLFMGLAQPLRVFLRSQGITKPMACFAGIAFAGHVFFLHVFINLLNLGARGAAIAQCCTSFNFFMMLLLYVRCYPGPHRQCWDGRFDAKALNPAGWKPLLKQAIPSFVSLYLQRWFYEGMVIMAGWLPDPHVPVGAMAVAMNVFSLVTMLPMAFNIAGATRVGNELGANAPRGAQVASRVAFLYAVCIGVMWCVIITSSREVIPRVFTTDGDVRALCSTLLVALGVCQLFNCPMSVLGGLLRGVGKPSTVVVLSLSSYYVIGLPTSVTLTFYKGWGALGLWWGLTIAQSVMVTLMVIVVTRLSWQELADKARSRAKEGGRDAEKVPRKGGWKTGNDKAGAEVEKLLRNGGAEKADVEAGVSGVGSSRER
ncbi:MATE efflux family protein [Klebsormidium nitens]|uniref:Protein DETOXIFICATION n=1 Tax=Klebsormidium nitens TaxID=105231 RepID=A0A1Y1I5Q7_KLENI|nr:MATE efflux family protein [Klebsormidium nitens]|eukprot:GAQ84057.1 MATE efflux family protein [Klebsormidium nitens]